MERNEIIKLSKKINNLDDLEQIKKDLKEKYEFSHGNYDEQELKKAISEKNPVIIKNHFLIGYDPNGGPFVDVNNEKVPVERMIKAIIIEGENESPEISIDADPFAIIGKNEWSDISQFLVIFGRLKVGEIFLPPHSAIFNFIDPTKAEKKEKIASVLDGININLYSEENYIDNAIHETGHLFWRDCLNYNEKRAFKTLFNTLKPSAIYAYEWERETEEEVFCTVYKWYVKSLLLNKAFYNILEFEEPKGLQILQGVLSRLAQNRQIEDTWNLSKQEIFDYITPKFDTTTGKYLRKAGVLDRIKNVEIPAALLNNIEKYQDGIEYIRLEKAVVPVQGNKIAWEHIK